MPIYEYECQACGQTKEILQKISDDPIKDCPVCAKPEMKKLISAAGFRLKGAGWYETDFKSGSKKNIAGDLAKKPAAADATKKTQPADSGKKVASESK